MANQCPLLSARAHGSCQLVLCWLTLQAEAEAERLNTTFEALAEAALEMGTCPEDQGMAASAAAAGSHATAAAPGAEAGAGQEGWCEEASAAASRVALLQRAEAAEQVGSWLLVGPKVASRTHKLTQVLNEQLGSMVHCLVNSIIICKDD